MRAPSALAAAGAALVGGMVVAGLAQLAPPTRPLTHEFAQLAGIIGFAGLWLQARWEARRPASAAPGPLDPGAPATALVRTAAYGLGAWGVQWATSTLLWDCRTSDGGVYLWATWLPMGLLAVAGGRASRRLGTAGHLVLVTALVVLDLATVAVQGLRGLRIVDPLIGLPQLVDQRADMGLVGVHALQRLWLLGVALVVGLVDRQGWRRGAPAVAVLAVLSVALGSHIGVGIGRAHLEEDLPGLQSEGRLRLRHRTDNWSAAYAPTIRERALWELDQLESEWGLRMRDPVELRIYESSDHMVESTGIRASHAGPMWVDLVLDRALTSTLGHELVHAEHAEWSQNPLLLLMRGMVEGAAKAWEERLDLGTAGHEPQAAALANGDLPSAAVFMRPGGFFKVNESTAYAAAGSFVGWLIGIHGIDPWIALQQSLDWEAAYGRSLEELDADWQAFLATIPADLDTRKAAAERFDPDLRPAYVDQSCPKVGRRSASLAEQAENWSQIGDHTRAGAALATLYAEGPTVRLLLQRVAVLQSAGDHAGALALLDAESPGLLAPATGDDAPGPRPLDEDQLLQARIASLAALGRSVPLDQALAARLSLRAQAGDDLRGLRRLRRLLLDPAPAADTRRILVARSSEQPALVRALQVAHPGNDDVWELFLDKGLRLPTSRRWVARPDSLVRTHDEALAALALTTLDCARWGDPLLTTAEVAVDEGDAALLARVEALLRRDCGDREALMSPLERAHARLAWRQQRAAATP